MPMDVSSPATTARNFSLDAPPPAPKGGGSPFMPPPKPASGIGDMANSPQIMTMQGLAMVKDGMQLICNGLPALAQMLNNTVTDLEQLIAQASAEALSGQGPQVAPAPPGVAPMMTPPPGAAPPSPATPQGMGGSGGPFSAA